MHEYNYPKRKHGVYQSRTGTRRDAVYKALKKRGGATFEELSEQLDYPERALDICIRDLHYQNGFGLRTDARGKIHLVNEA